MVKTGTTTLMHNHTDRNGLKIYGECPRCDAHYEQVIAEALETKQKLAFKVKSVKY